MSGVKDTSGEPAPKKLRTSSTDEAPAAASTTTVIPVAMTTSQVTPGVVSTQEGGETKATMEGKNVVKVATVTGPVAIVTTAGAVIAGQNVPGTTALVATGEEVVSPPVVTVAKSLQAAPTSPVVTRPVAVVTNGSIRPSLQTPQSDTALKIQGTPTIQTTKVTPQVVSTVTVDSGQAPVQQTPIRPALQLTTPGMTIPFQQTWTIRPVAQTKSPISQPSSIPQGKTPLAAIAQVTQMGQVTLGTGAQQQQRYPASQVVTLQHRVPAPTSILTRPPATKPPAPTTTEVRYPTQTVVTQKLSQTDVKSDASLTSPTQISLQIPVNRWNTAGSKSLLDSSNKLSMVNLNTSDAKSLLQDTKTTTVDSPAASVIVTDTQQTFKMANTNPKTFVTGTKIIGSLTTGQVINQASSGIVTIPRTGTVVTNTAMPQKILINNKQYATQVVTQIVKTDPSRAKITMAEAQIMLPSGPAKISWPVHSQVSTTESKQILITSPMMKSGQLTQGKTFVTQKPGGSVTFSPSGKITHVSNIATAKVVEVGSPSSKSTLTGASTSNLTPTKMSVLPAQKNWELIKQAQQLMPRKVDSSSKPLPEAVKTIVESRPAQSELKASQPIKTVQSSETSQPSDISKVSKEAALVTSTETSKESNKPVKTNAQKQVPESQETGKDSKPDGPKSEEALNKNTEKSKDNEDNNEVNKLKMEMLGVGPIKTGDTSGGDSGKKVTTETLGVSLAGKTVTMEMLGVGLTGKTELKIAGGEVTVKKEEFDPVEAMNWKDGVGELPGSNLKFRMNDLGVLEVITDDLECTETLNTSNESEAMETTPPTTATTSKMEENDNATTEQTEMEVDGTERKPEPPPSNKDEITQCANCGEYGFATDFYKEGRFCSQTCVGAFDSKRMRGVKKHGTMSKVVLGLKKGSRKKLLLKDSMNRDSEAKTDLSMLGSKKSKAFVWTKYLEKEKATEAPARLFKNPFPCVKNQFRVGMKLEGIDPMHQSLFCVLSVAEVCGYRIRLHFDGYSECFDFWTDADSSFIFPIGFCEKNGKTLQPPKGFSVEEFTWPSYLKLTKGVPAPKSNFLNQPVPPVTPNLFRIGSKLEAVDKKNSSLICVASVADTLGDKVLVHFDSWEDNYDYWCDLASPFVHPIGYCESIGVTLSPPIDWKDPDGFTWDKFLSKTKTQAVPARAFKPRPMVGFEVGMKVEVVDKRNPLLVRVASIAETNPAYIIRVHLDGWSDVYDYWLDDDSPDIHPPGWCAKTGHPLVPPISPSDLVINSGPGVCPTPGCKGIGHIKGAKYAGHHSTFGCPYSELNMNKESVVGDRLGPSLIKPDDTGHSANRFEGDYEDNSVTSQPKLLSTPSEVMPKKFGRGRRPKSYYLHLEEQKREREQERLEKEETLRQGIHNSVFTSSMISPAKSEVPLCWEQHSKLLPGVTNIRGNDVNKWTIEQVAAFVNTLPGCQEQAKLFKEEQIDGEAFLLLTQSDIVKIMNIKLGPALKIFNSIIMFKNSVEV